MAENAQQKAFVTGTPVPLGDLDLSRASVTVHVNAAVLDQTRGAEVMGDPINSIVWLANKLAETAARAGHPIGATPTFT
jgi:2-keto-4-pentenoate hydratase